MSDAFDPYKAWLSLENKTASTTYYKLLGLPEFESDKDRITSAADRAIRQVRSHRPGEHAAEWSKILDELAEVKACLLDDQKKAAYDDDLHFADEFVRELEGGIKCDPAAVAVKAAISPAKKAAKPAPQDPRYPPGMGPAKSAPPQPDPTEKKEKEIELKVGVAPKPVDPKDSPLYPPMRSSSSPPARQETSEPEPVQPEPPQQREPVAAQPAFAGEPQPPTNASIPAPAPYQPGPMAPQPQPGYYPPPGASAMAPAWQGAPPQPMGQVPMYPGYAPQPGYAPPAAYPYGAPMAQPLGYAPAPMPGPYPGAPTYGAPAYPAAMPGYMPGYPGASAGTAPIAMPLAPQGYMGYPPTPPTPAALDPMAPVAIPGTAVPTAAPLAVPPAAIPVGTAMASAATPAAIPEGKPVVPAADASPMKPAMQEPAAEVRSGSASSVMLAARKEKDSQKNMMIMGVGGLLVVVAAVIVYFAMSGAGLNTAANTQPGAGAPGVGAPVMPTPTGTDKTQIKPSITNPATPTPVKPEPTKPTPPKPEPVKPDPPKTTVEKPVEPIPTKPELTKPEPPKPDPPKPEPPKPEPPKPEPTPPAAEMPTREEVVLLGNALKNAKVALGEFNFSEAESDLAKADKLAKLPEHRDKLARLKEIAGYVKQFHDRLVQSATTMEAATSFKIGTSTIVGMVEANQRQVVLRIAGQNKTYEYADLPVGLAAALADMKLEGSDPVSRVVKGAYVACHKGATPDQLQQAKSWWDEATLGGADVTHLIPFLTDSYDLAKDLDKLQKKDAATSDAAKPGEKAAETPATPGKTKPASDPKAILEGKAEAK